MDITIGRCGTDEVGDVTRFIDQHWEPGHVLATCQPLLDWQHRDPDGRGYCFMVARRQRDRAVLGILGYIPTRRFDSALEADTVIWLTMWKVRGDANVAGLGLLLLQSLTRSEPHIAVGALGLNPATIPIYKALGFRVGELHHYVRVNATVQSLQIATLISRPVPPPASGPLLTARPMTRDSEFCGCEWTPHPGSVPRKTPEYFRMRYARHPVYAYTVVALLDAGAPVGLMAVRTAEYQGRRALRIVDFLGAEGVLARIGPVVQGLLEEVGAEYADVHNFGIDPLAFERAGFRRIDPNGPEIVPDHFEPFERRNVPLWFSVKGTGHVILFKGDSDQDRPNRVPHSDS